MLIEESIVIRRPAGAVFDFVSDYRNDPRWRRGVAAMTPTPPGPAADGTRVHEVLRFAGRTHVTDTTVHDVVPGRSLRFEGAGTGGRVRGRRSVQPVADGTRLTNEVHVETGGLLRLFEPLLAPLFRRGTRRDLATLKQLLEGAGPVQTATDPAAAVSAPNESNAAVASRR
jgi:hypothetical protein